MGMSTHVVGIKAPTEQYLRMLAVHDACEEAGVGRPQEVEEFFDGIRDPEHSGIVVDLQAREWKDEWSGGYEIDVDAIPEGVTTIRFFNSWQMPDIGWKWLKWTFGFWIDLENHTLLGIDFGPLEICWRTEGYRP